MKIKSFFLYKQKSKNLGNKRTSQKYWIWKSGKKCLFFDIIFLAKTKSAPCFHVKNPSRFVTGGIGIYACRLAKILPVSPFNKNAVVFPLLSIIPT